MGIDAAIGLLLALIQNSSVISSIISKAKSEGRTTLTAEEVSAIRSAADSARADLAANIAAHGG